MDWKHGFVHAAAVAELTLGVWAAHAQSAPQAPPASADDALHAMSDAAGVVFTGTVTAVRRPQLPDASPARVVEIDFAVTDSIRGVSGPNYTLREWAGLWAANDQPLRLGQRYLMLLHAPNAAGLSSPVGGADGAIPVRGVGPVATPEGAVARANGMAGAAFLGAATAVSTEVVDLGWVATHAAVPVVYAAVHDVGANPILVHASARGVASPEPSASGAPGIPGAVQQEVRATPYSAVAQNLRMWEAARVASR